MTCSKSNRSRKNRARKSRAQKNRSRKNRSRKNRNRARRNRALLGPWKIRVKDASLELKHAMDALKQARADAADAHLVLMIARKDADKKARSKLDAELELAEVEVARAMDVHTRAKAALMAARELGAYEPDFVASRKALTKAQKVYARILKLVIKRGKQDRRKASWIHRSSGDAAFAARKEGVEVNHLQLYDDQTIVAQRALLMVHSEVSMLEWDFPLLKVKNLLLKLSDVYLTLANLVLRHGPEFIQKRVSRLQRNVASILVALKLELANTEVVYDTIAPGQLFPAESADHDAKHQLYLDLSNHWARTAEDSTMPWDDASV